MSPGFRRIMAVAVACAIAFVIVRLLGELANQVTMPPGVDPTNMAQVERAIDHGEFPLASLALVVCGWLLAAYLGARIALRVGRTPAAAWVFTGIFTVATVANLMALHHPLWMWLGGTLGVPAFGLGGAGESITITAV